MQNFFEEDEKIICDIKRQENILGSNHIMDMLPG